MKRIKDEIPGLLFAALNIALGVWLLNSGDLSSRICGKGSCVSGPAIALSAITIGLMFLAVSVNRLIPEKLKEALKEQHRRLKIRRQLRNAPKYMYGKFPPRDDAAIDEVIRKARNDKKMTGREHR